MPCSPARSIHATCCARPTWKRPARAPRDCSPILDPIRAPDKGAGLLLPRGGVYSNRLHPGIGAIHRAQTARDPCHSGQTRHRIAELLIEISAPSYAKYARRHSWRMTALVALRLMVEFRRERIRLGACLTADAFDKAPLARYRTHPGLGVTLEVEPSTVEGVTSWTVSGPAYMAGKRDRTLVVLGCSTNP